MPAAERGSEGTATRSGFRPDIEGLRAVAILTVLAHHAGLPLHGGFVGVDVFFVISGFLITGLLVAELDRSGTISWSRFVGRRVRRLLPAAVLVLVVTSLVSFVVVPGLRRRDIGVDIAASAAYVVNWVFARREVDYLASDLRPSPVQHYWSLAVEEQFYVVWPLLLIVLSLLVRRPSRRVVALALGTLVASSFLWSLWFSHASPRPAFFTTTTRVWELGIGALLAVALAGRPRPDPEPGRTPGSLARAALGWAALVALLAVAAFLPEGIEWPSAWALLPTVPTAVLIWVGWRGAPLGPVRLLGSRPLVWVGALSYSIYLWHWPVIVLGEWTVDWAGSTLPAWGTVALALASLVPAWLSWRLVESPIHHGPWLRERPRAVLAGGLALSCAGVLVALPLLPLRSPFDTTPPGGVLPPVSALGAATVRLDEPPAGVDDPGWVTPDPLVSGEDRPAADVDRCQVDVATTEPLACTFGDPDGPTTVALVGDSKAMQWLPALEEAASSRGWRVVTWGKSSCAFSNAPATEAGLAYPECDAWRDAVLGRLRADPPDVVVTSGVATSAWTADGPQRRPLVEGYASLWRSLADGGVPVVVVGDSPLSPDDLDICAARHPRELTRCAFDAGPATSGSGLPVQREAAAASGPGVRLLDLTAWICPEERCPVVIGNVAVHRAGDHLTATYAATLAPRVAAAVEQALERGPQG
ncbi:SGNH hydrolase domain-containing protein [Fodinibacter luteus]|uniref:SGNH hydrolase domain-containing protein n=1 Tax=Fodinibacter luteus TaxID=552064 RepID=A0ABP8K5U1_9MICO